MMTEEMIASLAEDQAKLESLKPDTTPFSYSRNVTIQVMLTAVTSSNIAAVGHHQALGLVIEFKNGGIYSYPKVSPLVFQDMLEAESVGSFFHSEIRKKNEPYLKLN